MWTWYYITLLVVFWFFGVPFGLHSRGRYEQYMCYYYELHCFDTGFLMLLASLICSWLAAIYWESLIILDSARFERKKRAAARQSVENLINQTDIRKK